MNKNWRFWATLVLGIAVLFGTSGKSFASGAEDAANAALVFEKLKTLVGRWVATTEKGKVTTTYELISGGSALLERMEIPEWGICLPCTISMEILCA